MKTLDEVIDLMEGADFIDWGADALHYLKAYKDDRDDLTALRAYWKEQHENNALTWDELRTMEGKPVWVELKRKETEVSRKAWGLNDGTYIDAFGYDIITIKVLHDLWHLSKAQLGQTWQAYRKEWAE